MPFRIHDLHVETRERSSTTDDLRGRADLGDLGRHARLAQRERMFVDGNDVPAAKRNRQSVLGQPVRGIKTLRLQSVGLERLQKPGEGVRFYRFRGR